MSSVMSQSCEGKCSEELKSRFIDPDLDMAKVEKLMTEFVSAAKEDSCSSKGWSQSTYGTSKIGVTLMSFVQQKELDNDPSEGIVVNACCPGFVDTDLTSDMGIKTIDEGQIIYPFEEHVFL